MYRKVFISYAKEDIRFANELYDHLNTKKYDPWLDKNKLLPGDNWDVAIKNALREADFIILLLSSRSVSKRGYVQREYKLALQHWEAKLESDIYIIPVLIDDCKVPESLTRFQWIKYDNSNTYEAILKALDVQRNIYLKDAYHTDLTDAHYTKSLPLDLYIPLNIESSVEFPQFPQNPLFNAEYVNAFIQHDIMEQMSYYASFMSDEDYYRELPEHLREHLYFSSNYEIHYISSKYLSLILFVSAYWGGPHPNHRIVTKNFSFRPVKKLSLKDVVKFDDIKDFIADSFTRYTNEYLHNEDEGHLVNRIKEEFEQWGATDMDFVFNADLLTLMSNNMLPHAFQGAANIEIPLKDVELLIAP
ncbi:TIR domain-containing protein [Mucilaginibacter sp. ZT4R22]|uniref:TIR domain-containing protein n=1 Tax=Mucilaginibacter pankratovii TaxID=2772110 RepID=A0ABR7WSW6_9SPHI|nr:TIR domain-containing protein [Mucilaginibacter pankratovii]MBD1365385.1 TIR domain-containing protein [Mucilaginibacter pankratovii]